MRGFQKTGRSVVNSESSICAASPPHKDVPHLDIDALVKRLARTGGLACMISGGILCGQAINDALNGVPDATLQAAIFAALFSFGGMLFFWSKRPPPDA